MPVISPLAPGANSISASSDDAGAAAPLAAPAVMTLSRWSTYPLTVVQAERVVAIHKEENAKINGELEAIRSLCKEKCHSTTTKCVEHSKGVRQCWRTYYTNLRPGSWISYRSQEYLDEMTKLFDSNVKIQKIHARAAEEMRMHYKDALCTVRPNDDPDVKKYKQEAARMYDDCATEAEIRDFITQEEAKVDGQRTLKQREYAAKLAACKTENDKLSIYQEDACTPLDSDTHAMAKLRLRWKGLFESGIPYPEIHIVMRKDIEDHLKRERDLKERLDGLKRAKAAHDKEEIAKEVEKIAKETAARIDMLSKYTFYCTTEGCQNLAVPLSQEEGVLECGICYRMFQDEMHKIRSFFCSEECMDRDGCSHILKAHNCVSTACTTGVFRSVQEKYCGHCMDCWNFFCTLSYFCTKECWEKNLTDHCNQRHVQLRRELIEKLENSKDEFESWGKKMKVAEDETRKVLMSYSWPTDP